MEVGNDQNHLGIDINLSCVQLRQDRNNANGCLSVVLWMWAMSYSDKTEIRRLLCILFVWWCALPTYSRKWKT